MTKERKYLGETDVTDSCEMTRDDFIFEFIGYGQYDESHHKQWALDQIVRILCDAPVTVKEAKWDDGHTETRVTVGTCQKYIDWVVEYKGGEDGPDTYDYDEGVPP